MSIRNWLPSERPREKLMEHGAQSLSNAELLAWRGLDTAAQLAADNGIAAAEYLRDERGDYRPYGVVVLTVRGAGISRVSSFGDPGLVRLFGFP